MIEDVESLSCQLEAHTLSEEEFLGNRHVRVDQARSPQRISRNISEGSRVGSHPGALHLACVSKSWNGSEITDGVSNWIERSSMHSKIFSRLSRAWTTETASHSVNVLILNAVAVRRSKRYTAFPRQGAIKREATNDLIHPPGSVATNCSVPTEGEIPVPRGNEDLAAVVITVAIVGLGIHEEIVRFMREGVRPSVVREELKSMAETFLQDYLQRLVAGGRLVRVVTQRLRPHKGMSKGNSKILLGGAVKIGLTFKLRVRHSGVRINWRRAVNWGAAVEARKRLLVWICLVRRIEHVVNSMTADIADLQRCRV